MSFAGKFSAFLKVFSKNSLQRSSKVRTMDAKNLSVSIIIQSIRSFRLCYPMVITSKIFWFVIGYSIWSCSFSSINFSCVSSLYLYWLYCSFFYIYYFLSVCFLLLYNSFVLSDSVLISDIDINLTYKLCLSSGFLPLSVSYCFLK